LQDVVQERDGRLFLGVAKDRQATLCLAVELLLR
jgi:hypothetical protein